MVYFPYLNRHHGDLLGVGLGVGLDRSSHGLHTHCLARGLLDRLRVLGRLPLCIDKTRILKQSSSSVVGFESPAVFMHLRPHSNTSVDEGFFKDRFYYKWAINLPQNN
jgi:hypothetical protein